MKNLVVGLALLSATCTPAAQPQAQPQPAAAPVSTSPVVTSNSAAATPPSASALDVVVFLALDSAPKDLGDRARAGAAAMLAEAERDGAETHVAVVAGKKDRADAVLSAVAKAIDFDLAPKDALLSAAVAGCGVNDSDFPDPHLAGSNPKVCGNALLGLAGNTAEAITHSWLWALNPVKGALTGFFRPGAKRLYAFVANGDAQLFDAAAFAQIVGAQGGGATSTVVAVPLTPCGLDEAAATRYPALPGAKLDLCTATAAQMGAAMAQALKLATP